MSALHVEAPLQAQDPLPLVCVVTIDGEFLDVLTSELAPWFELTVGDTYEGLARGGRETGVFAVLLEMDTEEEVAFWVLLGLNELRKLNPDLTLISMSRAR